jgi:hypothetical protein
LRLRSDLGRGSRRPGEEPIEKLYGEGLLPAFSMFGERKGGFTAILNDQSFDESRVEFLHRAVNIAGQLDCGDYWAAQVVNLGSPDNWIINANPDNVSLYLNSLKMLWQLGATKPYVVSRAIVQPDTL